MRKIYDMCFNKFQKLLTKNSPQFSYIVFVGPRTAKNSLKIIIEIKNKTFFRYIIAFGVGFRGANHNNENP